MELVRAGRPKHVLTNMVKEAFAELYIRYKSLGRRPNTTDIIHEFESRPSRYSGYRKYGISEKTIRTIIRDLPVTADQQDEDRLWQPWHDHGETAEQSCYLLQLRVVARLVTSSPQLALSRSQVTWAKRIQPLVTDLDPLIQYMIVQEYGIRQDYSEITGDPANTEALDNFLAYQPWKKENGHIWGKAVGAGRVDVQDAAFHINHPLYDQQSLRERIDAYIQGTNSDGDVEIPTWQEYASSLISEDGGTDSVPVTFFGGSVEPEDEFIESGEMWL